jgi:hypothetical protein
MVTWTAKDPDAVLDYIYRIPLDANDSVASATPWIARLAGTVVIDSQALAATPNTTTEGYGQDLTVWLSGGAAEETSVFRVSWVTADGRTDDDVITLPVIESDVAPLVLTGYAKPSPAHLAIKYPAFAAVAASTIQFWLTDAERYVTNAWSERDYAAGLMALAAHNMAVAGIGAEATALTGIPAGVTAMKSGSLALNFTPEAANARLTGDLSGTPYGQEYAGLLRRNRGGPLVAPSGIPPFDAYPVGWPAGWP